MGETLGKKTEKKTKTRHRQTWDRKWIKKRTIIQTILTQISFIKSDKRRNKIEQKFVITYKDVAI